MSSRKFKWQVVSKSSVNLVYAVPVTLASCKIGIANHQHWYPRIKALRDALEARSIPEEILVLIEREFRSMARSIGEDAWSLIETRFNETSSCDCFKVERQELLQQIWAEMGNKNVDLQLGDGLTKKNYTEEVFGLSLLLVGPEDAYDKLDISDFQHVYLCLPSHLVQCLPAERMTSDEYAPASQIEIATSKTRMNRLDSTICPRRRCYREGCMNDSVLSRTTIIDPEYFSLTTAKILQVNKAIRDLDLDVVQPDQTPPAMELTYRLASNVTALHGSGQRSHRDNAIPITQGGFVNMESESWPQVVDENHGRLWLPQLVLSHQQEVHIPKEKVEHSEDD